MKKYQINILPKRLSILLTLQLLLWGCVHEDKISLAKIAPGSTFTGDGKYIIGEGDEIAIKIIGQDNLTSLYKVSQAGEISFPLIGFQKAAGKTIQMLTVAITKKLKPYIKNPIVSISIQRYNSYKVFFSGEISNPGVYTFSERTTLLQGIARAGGLSRFASGTVIVIRKTKKGTTRRYWATYETILNKNSKLDILVLERGDVVHIK